MRREVQAIFRYSFAAVMISLVVSSIGIAKDLEALTRLLVPAFLAQNFGLVCAADDANFLSDVPNGPTSLIQFANHIKKEVTIGLPENEASEIRVMAANTALFEARAELKRVENETAPGEGIKRWCDNSVRPFIFGLLKAHDEKHTEFDARIESAKR